MGLSILALLDFGRCGGRFGLGFVVELCGDGGNHFRHAGTTVKSGLFFERRICPLLFRRSPPDRPFVIGHQLGKHRDGRLMQRFATIQGS
jgi:hypothetical protein